MATETDCLVPLQGQNTAAVQHVPSNAFQRFRWRTEKIIFLVDAKEKCIDLSWISAKLPSQGYTLESTFNDYKLGMVWHFLSKTHSPLTSEQNALELYPGTKSWFMWAPNFCSSWEELLKPLCSVGYKINILTLEVAQRHFLFKESFVP